MLGTARAYVFRKWLGATFESASPAGGTVTSMATFRTAFQLAGHSLVAHTSARLIKLTLVWIESGWADGERRAEGPAGML